jgi:hypothetical protein
VENAGLADKFDIDSCGTGGATTPAAAAAAVIVAALVYYSVRTGLCVNSTLCWHVTSRGRALPRLGSRAVAAG